jgi:hypothetical protein
MLRRGNLPRGQVSFLLTLNLHTLSLLLLLCGLLQLELFQPY